MRYNNSKLNNNIFQRKNIVSFLQFYIYYQDKNFKIKIEMSTGLLIEITLFTSEQKDTSLMLNLSRMVFSP